MARSGCLLSRRINPALNKAVRGDGWGGTGDLSHFEIHLGELDPESVRNNKFKRPGRTRGYKAGAFEPSGVFRSKPLKLDSQTNSKMKRLSRLYGLCN